MKTASAVVTSNLGKRFPGGRQALSGVTLDVPAGQIVSIIGRSGSGKSTLLRCLNGLILPSQGHIEVLGRNLAQLSSRELRVLRGQIGLIMQQFGLVGRLSALENVLAGSLGTLRGPRLGIAQYPEAFRIRALEQLTRVGLKQQAFQRADTLSGGQMQRVAIARALMQRPQIVLADEPVASLDPESSKAVLSLLKDLAAELGLTVIASMHQFEAARQWSDRIIGLVDGAIVLDKRSSDVTKRDADKVYQPSL